MRVLALALCLLIQPASGQERPHLCRPGETPAFSCATGGKIASLCATPDAEGATRALTYRFGTRRKLELTYPDEGTRPPDAFRYRSAGYSAGGAEFLTFSISATKYILYSDYYRGKERDGIMVERGEKRIAHLLCRGTALDGREGWSRIYKAKVPQAEENFDVPGIAD